MIHLKTLQSAKFSEWFFYVLGFQTIAIALIYLGMLMGLSSFADQRKRWRQRIMYAWWSFDPRFLWFGAGWAVFAMINAWSYALLRNEDSWHSNRHAEIVFYVLQGVLATWGFITFYFEMVALGCVVMILAGMLQITYLVLAWVFDFWVPGVLGIFAFIWLAMVAFSNWSWTNFNLFKGNWSDYTHLTMPTMPAWHGQQQRQMRMGANPQQPMGYTVVHTHPTMEANNGFVGSNSLGRRVN